MGRKKSGEQRLAEAETAKMIAEFDILAERAAAAGMPAKQVRAIRYALDLCGLLDYGDDHITELRDDIDSIVDALEADREDERRAAAKEGASQ